MVAWVENWKAQVGPWAVELLLLEAPFLVGEGSYGASDLCQWVVHKKKAIEKSRKY